MIVFVTAANNLYREVCDYNVCCAKKYGKFDKILNYDIDSMMDQNYREQHSAILKVKRGAGLWLWKVYFIEKALREECCEGDILFYADAASFFFRSVRPVLSQMAGDIFAVNVPFVEEEFTKRETFEIMGLTDVKYTKTRQFHASFMAFKRSEQTISFVREWKQLCEDIRLLSQDVCFGNQIDNFIAHRNDQSIFSLLCKKYNVHPSEDPSQYGITGYGKYRNATLLPLSVTKSYPFCIMLHKQAKLDRMQKVKCWLKILKRLLINLIR